jgi:hypothetical protein
MVRTQFEAHKNETDENKIEALQANAVRGLSNYMLFRSGSKDEKLQKAMSKFHKGAVEDAKRNHSRLDDKSDVTTNTR